MRLKIIGVLSSPRRNGNTARLFREALCGANEAGAEVEEIYLPDYQIKYCAGCAICLSGDECIIKDDLNPLREKGLAADGIILASPTYEMDMNAMMKSFLDRIMPYIAYRSAFRHKYVATISTAGGFGAKQAAQRLTMINMGFHQLGSISGTLGVQVGFGATGPHLPKAYRLGRKIVDDVRRKKSYRLHNFFEKIVFKLFVGKMMEKMIIANKEKKRKGVYLYLKREGLIK
jgi:multimeric flavodoxin WrbA